MIEEELFHRALEKPTLAEQLAFLDQACADQPELRQRVERLLRSHRREDSFLHPPATTDEALSEKTGAVIGLYKLIEQIGEGGMGTVWMAQQTEPVKRLVALKLIKAGMDSAQVIARFEAERQALALMDHPNIAKVFDGGTTGEPAAQARGGAGRPYFVMELVKGVPITKYCDEHRLTPRQRLELFLPVCQAVQHAHQKGIIHRDLKPSNVLVAQYDGRPVPKVIDFGVAKATGQSLTDKTLVTGFGNIVGTLEYMSPEQAEVNQLDIDTRSDIYSLGVLLYELLTGSPPFTKKDLEKAGMLEMLRVIREQEPSKPSTKLSTAEGLPTLAANRGTEPAKLTKLVRGELDWIVMKALEKDRNRRYETANGFAMDVQRYLADEPVMACPPSAWYRFRKFARRNQAAMLGLAAVLAIVVMAGAAIWSWQLRHVEQDLHAELTRRGVESSLEQLKELHRRALWQQAEKLLDQAEQQLEPHGDPGLRDQVAQARRDTAFIKRLDDIRLEKSVFVAGQQSEFAADLSKYRDAFRENGLDILKDDPVELAPKLGASEVRDYLLASLDDWATNERSDNRQRIMYLTAAATGQGWRTQLSAVWEDAARLSQVYDAIPEQERTPAIIVVVGSTLDRLGQDGVGRLERGLRQYPSDFWMHYSLGVHHKKKRPDMAIGAYRAALAIRPGTSAALSNLGNVLDDQKEYDAAIAAHKEAIRLNPTFAVAHINLGSALQGKKEYDAAIAEYKEAIRLDAKFGLPHYNLGVVWRDKKERDAAIAEFKEAIRLDPKYAKSHCNLGDVLQEKKEYDAAIVAYREAIRLDPKFPVPHNNLGNVLYGKKEYDAAIAEFFEAMRLDPKSAEPHHGLGRVLHDKKEYDAAIAEYQEAIRLDPKNATYHIDLAIALDIQGKRDEAIAENRKAIEIEPKNVLAHHNLGNALSAEKKLDEAIAEYRKAIEFDPNFAESHVGLGYVLQLQGRLEGAIAHYRKAIELNPNHAMVHNNLAWQLATAPDVKLRNPAEAVKLANKAVELSPESALSWQVLGWGHYRLGAWNDSINALHKSIELQKDGGDPFQWFFLAMAHWQLGEKNEARKWYGQAAAWLEKNAPQDEGLRRFRAEAAELLGTKKKEP